MTSTNGDQNELKAEERGRVIAKAEYTDKGENPRFVVTSLEGDAQQLYDEIYCARGEMENRIKEQQLGLFSDRTSCHSWWANQFRLLLSSVAYVLMETIRRAGLKGTELARAQVGTIRLKLLKIGTVIRSVTHRDLARASSAGVEIRPNELRPSAHLRRTVRIEARRPFPRSPIAVCNVPFPLRKLAQRVRGSHGASIVLSG